MSRNAVHAGALAAAALGMFYALVVGGVGGLPIWGSRPQTTGRGW